MYIWYSVCGLLCCIQCMNDSMMYIAYMGDSMMSVGLHAVYRVCMAVPL